MVSNICSMPVRIFPWAEIQRFYDAGNGFARCRERFGFSGSAWAKAIRRGEITVRARRRYDWAEIQRYYDEGHSYAECRARFGFAPAAWTKAVLRGELNARARRWTLERVLLQSRSRTTVKRYLLEAGILLNCCDECGISEWRGHPLSIQLDHRNGNRYDHRLENLRMLCPNCHSQTETFGTKNWKIQAQSVPVRLTVRRRPLKSVIVVRIHDREQCGPIV